jgi:hypothetical protein
MSHSALFLFAIAFIFVRLFFAIQAALYWRPAAAKNGASPDLLNYSLILLVFGWLFCSNLK